MIRYVHTNIIAKDHKKLIDFYKAVFGCRSIGETRDLRGEWLDKLSGITNAHIIGEHLVLPGYGEDHPTIEIFSYDHMVSDSAHSVNAYWFCAPCVCEVDNVAATLEKLLANGGGIVSEIWLKQYTKTVGKQHLFMLPIPKVISLNCKVGSIDVK